MYYVHYTQLNTYMPFFKMNGQKCRYCEKNILAHFDITLCFTILVKHFQLNQTPAYIFSIRKMYNNRNIISFN